MSLYKLTIDMLELDHLLNSGEFTEDELKDTIEMISGEWDKKAEAVITVIKNYRAEIENIKREEMSLAKRRKSKENAVERLEAYLTDAMERLGKERYESARHQVSFSRSERLHITDYDALLEWAKANAPDIVHEGKATIYKDDLKALGDAVSMYVEVETRNNIQIR